MNNVPNNSIDAQMMTLCAISYVAEGQTISQIKESIEAELAKPSYATGGKWQLVWGPAKTPDKQGDNLVYIAGDKDSGKLAIVLRGTVSDSLESWLEDLPTALDLYPWGGATPIKVSNHFLDAINDIVMLRDPTTEVSFSGFVSNLLSSEIYVTGHSQGGGLAPMLHGYVKNHLGAKSIASYTFAAPTSGSVGFAQFVDETLQSSRIVNPLDIVPYGYAAMPEIWEKGIPTKDELPEDVIKGAVEAWELATKLKPGDFGQPQKCVERLPATHDPRPGASYYQRVEAQHNHNSYLYLMGAPQTDIGDPSPLPGGTE